ncbi:kinetochore protein Spc25-like [Corticium candelabrum]|uniref:kinetochore protein Spc25-like n=1 Tax=Corticium candelabrum TaxID=121492 RepID=UPI002E265F0C|nr:kinetochore protein Spc25-like [Corticium candelabrum]
MSTLSLISRDFDLSSAATDQSLTAKCSKLEAVVERFTTFQTERSDRAREESSAYREKAITERKQKLEAKQQAKQRVAEGKKELKEVNKMRKKLMKDIDSVSKELHEKLQIVDEETKANMKREEERSAKVDRVTENLQKILDKFHLHFRKIKGCQIQAVFNYVDRDDQDRNCYFIVKLLDGKVYEVTQTNPEVQDVDKLVAELNASQNFSRFVCTIRKRFQMAIEEEKKLS